MSSQAIAFDSALRCDFGRVGSRFIPRRAMTIQAASVVWLSLIGGRLSVAKNSHEPSDCCFSTISSAISFRLCLCPSSSADHDRAATASIGSPMFSPRPCGRGSGRSAGLGKILEASSLSLLPSKDSIVSVDEFLVDRVPQPLGFAERPQRHRHVMAGGTFARLQPGGAFGLQISNGPIDRLLNLRRGRGWNRSAGRGRHRGSRSRGINRRRQHHSKRGDARHQSISMNRRDKRPGRRD